MRKLCLAAATAACGAIVAMAATTASAANLYTSNFGVGPDGGKTGWEVYSPYGQVSSAIGYLISGAEFSIASPVASSYATLSFDIYGQRNVYGVDAPGHDPDTFSLRINGQTVLRANLGLNGGSDNIITDTTGGAQITKPSLGRRIVVPFTLLYQGTDPLHPIENVFDFSYSGLTTFDSDAYLINHVSIDYERGVVPSPTPEPGVWALMLLGFGSVGAAMRRHRSTPVRRSV